MELIGFLLGSILGSFVKVLADRGLTKKSFWGRSYCSQCKKTLRWYDLFPILSYLSLSGCCRYCKKKIKLEYLIIEIVLGLLIGYLFWQSKDSLQVTGYSLQFKTIQLILDLFFKTFFITILSALFITDLRKMLIPDRIILPSIILGFFALLTFTIYKVSFLYYYLSQSQIGRYLLPPYSDYFLRHAQMAAQPLLGGILMGLLIGGFFWGLIIITKGKGMGGGDVKLGAFIGLMLGFPQSLLAIMLSFIIGSIFSIVLLILGKKRFGQVIAFGPFLVIGSLITLFWGDKILDWYLKLGS